MQDWERGAAAELVPVRSGNHPSLLTSERAEIYG